jgi:hypothetical protein
MAIVDPFDAPASKTIKDPFEVSAPPKEPTFGEKAGAVTRGLATGVLGMGGELEKGFMDREPKLGETIFPTAKEVSGSLASVGIPEPRPELQKYQRYGQIAPDVALLGGGLYGLGRAGYMGAKELLGGAGKRAQEAAKRLENIVPGYAQEAERGVTQRAATETQAEYEKRARQQTGLKEAEKKFSTEAQQQGEDAARKLANLNPPKTKAALGDEMQNRLQGTEFRRSAERSRQAKNDADAYFRQATEKGQFVNSDEGKLFLKNLVNRVFSEKNTPAEKKIAQEMYQDLAEAKDIEAVEKTFRRFQEKASGQPKEGYDAVTQQFAGSVATELSNALNKFAPKREQFRNTYRELSGPLDAYETSFGAKPLAQEKKVEGQLKMMPTDYPDYYFKNRDTVNVLRQQLAGDEAAVRKFANQHISNELQGKTADQATQWVQKNSEWLNTIKDAQTGQGLNTRVNQYVQELKNAETKAQQATKLGSKAQEVGKLRETGQQKIAETAAQQKQKISEFKDQLNLYPEKSTNIANNMIKYLSEYKLLPPEKLKYLKAEVDAVSKTAEGAEKAKEIRNKFIKYGVISAAGYKTYEMGKSLF